MNGGMFRSATQTPLTAPMAAAHTSAAAHPTAMQSATCAGWASKSRVMTVELITLVSATTAPKERS